MTVIFDGNYLLHKTLGVFVNYHNGKTLQEILEVKENQNVYYRKLIIDFMSVLKKIEGVEKVVFAFDRKSWRYLIFDDYKHALTKTREQGYDLVMKVKDRLEESLEKNGFIVHTCDGFEGDDIIACWADWYRKNDETLLIVSGDKDLHQLIKNNIFVLNNNSTNYNLYGDESLDSGLMTSWCKEIGCGWNPINPELFILKKIILGDSGDNISNLKRGIGEKTFEKFVEGIKGKKIPVNFIPNLKNFIVNELNSTLKKKIDVDELYTAIEWNINLMYLHPDNLQRFIKFYEERKKIQMFLYSSYKYKKEFSLEHFTNAIIK